MFSLFKQWQRRKVVQQDESDAKGIAQDKGNMVVPRQIVNARPSELFYKKLTPALKSRGVQTTAPRSQWPKEVLRKVFQDLGRETPGDLISRFVQ